MRPEFDSKQICGENKFCAATDCKIKELEGIFSDLHVTIRVVLEKWFWLVKKNKDLQGHFAGLLISTEYFLA